MWLRESREARLSLISHPPPPTPHSQKHLLRFQRRRLFFRRRELPLHLILFDLFHRHARRLGVLALALWRGALHELLGALGHEQHVAELAVNALWQTFHLAPPSGARPSR